MESFPSCGNNVVFLWKLSGAFLGLSGAADAAWMAYARGAHTLSPLERKATEQWQAPRKKQDWRSIGSWFIYSSSNGVCSTALNFWESSNMETAVIKMLIVLLKCL